MGIYLICSISKTNNEVKKKMGSFKLLFSFSCLWIVA